MKIYQSLDGTCDIISDEFKLQKLPEFDGVVYQIQSKMIEKDQMGIQDVVYRFKYTPFSQSKTQFSKWLSGYSKKIADKLPVGEQERFKKGYLTFSKKVLSKFDDFTFYLPENMSTQDTVIFSFWKNEADEAPYFWYLLDGLKSRQA